MSEDLFGGRPLDDLLRERLRLLQPAINELDESELSDAEKLEEVRSQGLISPVVLSSVRRIGGYDRGDGTATLVVSIPFTGEPALLRCGPGGTLINPPRGAVTEQPGSTALGLEVSVRSGSTVNQIKDAIARQVAAVAHQIETQGRSIAIHNDEVERRSRSMAQDRRELLSRLSDVERALKAE